MIRLSQQRLGRRCALAVLAAGLILHLVQSAAAGDTVPFAAAFQGDFTITFGTGPGGTDDLLFSGDGLASLLGWSDV